MANPYFQFKQFRVVQDRCGMKVCTDACIFGAYTKMPGAGTILDIGTGTGLLSLMLAQQHPDARIDAVEVDKEAIEQARENVAASPWKDRVFVHHTPVQDYASRHLYDLIICNPPFYPDHLRSADPQRRQAFHQDSIRFPELIEAVRKFLAPNGIFSLLLPSRQAEEFNFLAAKAGLYIQQELSFFEHENSGQYRTVSFFGLRDTPEPVREKLIIRGEDGRYSSAFQQLLRPYYTIF